MQLTKDQINEMLKDAKPAIIEGLKQEVIRQAKWEMNPLISKMINDEVAEFMKLEIIPVIKKDLVESKEGLVLASVEFANSIIQILTSSMSKTLKENLESSWKREKILEALFKG